MRVEADFINDPASLAIFELLAAAGYPAYFVGGCVRNALIAAPVADIDISTPALPEQVTEVCRDGGLKVIPTGIEHGTVTVVSDGKPHEITTFRKDVETDGRRAVVAFSTEMIDDAQRRDFTMNALYADAKGRVIDPLSGLSDLQARRVRFILDADQRIKEDYLRSLRFFRFHAWYGDPDSGLDADALAAISDNLDGLDHLSAERVGAEMIRLLAAPDPASALAAMTQTGVLGRIIPGSDPKDVAPLVHLEGKRPPDAMRRLAALGGQDVADRLRLSRAQERQLEVLRAGMGSTESAGTLGYRHGAEPAFDILLLRHASMGTVPDPRDIAAAAIGARQVFPIKAADLMPELSGAHLGKRLKELEEIWIRSDFRLSKSDLLGQ